MIYSIHTRLGRGGGRVGLIRGNLHFNSSLYCTLMNAEDSKLEGE